MKAAIIASVCAEFKRQMASDVLTRQTETNSTEMRVECECGYLATGGIEHNPRRMHQPIVVKHKVLGGRARKINGNDLVMLVNGRRIWCVLKIGDNKLVVFGRRRFVPKSVVKANGNFYRTHELNGKGGTISVDSKSCLLLSPKFNLIVDLSTSAKLAKCNRTFINASYYVQTPAFPEFR